MDVFLYEVRNSYFDKRIPLANNELSLYSDDDVTAYQKGWFIFKHHHYLLVVGL